MCKTVSLFVFMPILLIFLPYNIFFYNHHQSKVCPCASEYSFNLFFICFTFQSDKRNCEKLPFFNMFFIKTIIAYRNHKCLKEYMYLIIIKCCSIIICHMCDQHYIISLNDFFNDYGLIMQKLLFFL